MKRLMIWIAIACLCWAGWRALAPTGPMSQAASRAGFWSSQGGPAPLAERGVAAFSAPFQTMFGAENSERPIEERAAQTQRWLEAAQKSMPFQGGFVPGAADLRGAASRAGAWPREASLPSWAAWLKWSPSQWKGQIARAARAVPQPRALAGEIHEKNNEIAARATAIGRQAANAAQATLRQAKAAGPKPARASALAAPLAGEGQ